LPSAELKLEISHAFDYVPFSALYGLAFSEIDLFGTRTLEIASGNLLSVHAGGLANTLSLELTSTDPRTNAGTFITCDTKAERLREVDAGPALSACKKWAAVSVSSLFNEPARLAAETPSNILVAPFALSSLTTTFVIYFVCFILLYTALVRKALMQLVGSRVLAVEKIPLTISAGTVYLLFLIPLALVSYLLGH
jgi:hypothetical protein